MSKAAPSASEVIIAELQKMKDAIISEIRVMITADSIESAKASADVLERLTKMEELLAGQKKAIKTTSPKEAKTPAETEKPVAKLPLNIRAYFLGKYKDAEYRKQFNTEDAKKIIAKDEAVGKKPEDTPARYNAEAVALWKEYSTAADKTVYNRIKKEFEDLKAAATDATPTEPKVAAEPVEDL